LEAQEKQEHESEPDKRAQHKREERHKRNCSTSESYAGYQEGRTSKSSTRKVSTRAKRQHETDLRSPPSEANRLWFAGFFKTSFRAERRKINM
jgi:hypothetical protein